MAATSRLLICRHGMAVLMAATMVAGCGGGGGSPPVGPSPAPIAPSISVQPADTNVADGAIANFSVTAAGDAPLMYQWRRNGVDLVDGAGVAGAASAALALTAPFSFNASQISVRVSNAAGDIVSNNALLTVTAVAKAWGPAVRINPGDAFSHPGYAQVAVDAAGNAIAVWQEETAGATRNAVWSSRYLAGAVWSTAATIDNAVGNAIQPQIAITPSGTAVAAFPQTLANFGGGLNLVVNRFSGAWGMPHTIDALDITSPQNPRVGLAPDGAATVVFDQSDGTVSRVWANRSNAAGFWGAAAIIDGAGPTNVPEVAVAANGHAVMAWVQQTGAFTRALWASRNTGVGWSTPVLITTDTGEVLSAIRIAIDDAGNAVGVWSQRMGNGRVAVRASVLVAATGLWNATATLSDSARDSFSPQIGRDGSGNAIAVWHEASGANVGGIWASRNSGLGGSWSTPVLIQPATAPRGVLPKIGVDGNGNAIAVWLQPVAGAAGFHVYASHFSAAGVGVWSAPVNLMADLTAYALVGSDMEPVIAVNANGEAVVVWYQRTDVPASVGIWARVYR